MNRLDRALAILLLLRSGKTASAVELARRFEVSPRTIYRDIEKLGAIGVPVYAEMGRTGGFRLMEGYFLPPVMFSVGEAISLVLGLTSLRRLRARPFAAELETAEQKLLAATPDHLRATLAKARQVIGFERPPVDAFTLERAPSDAASEAVEADEGRIVTVFLQAMLEHREVALHYRSPYRDAPSHSSVNPLGLLWDRDRWYLVGQRVGRKGETRLWRADRVLTITPRSKAAEADGNFDAATLLGRKWLGQAMQQWIQEAPVTLRLAQRQAERLKQDWYYQHARFEDLADGQVLMTYGETNREYVFELLRWLGPEAELLEPKAWRAELRDNLARMLALYAND
ncbi:MAG: WYL protein [Anaerolineales bacterium]|nr:WYL protein [Anaerolineales bacterium]